VTSDSGSLLDRINKLIESDRLSLPVFNKVAYRLREIAAQPDHDVAEVERLISSDQALAVEVLRAANSPFFCGLVPIRTIRNAVVRLGINQVTRLVYLASEHAKYKAADPQLMIMLEELWRHSSTTAMAAQWLAKRLQSQDIEEECFLGGLLHDIGELLILKAIDEIKKTEGQDLALSPPLIKEVLNAAHCQLGANLLRHWNIPDVYCVIAKTHHDCEFDAANLALIIVRLANEAARKAGTGLDPDPSLILYATPEAHALRSSEVLLAEFEIMIEDHICQPVCLIPSILPRMGAQAL
jgi:putative nucleotidyltransferase with HDIG domain